MDAKKDYYAVLGVLPSAEEVVIRAAYRALAQRYHPDRLDGPHEDVNGRMAEINEAYAILSDATQRKEYDRLRGSNTQAGDSYFGAESEDAPPSFDPLEREWSIAAKYYPDLRTIEARLARISWRLAYSFRAYLLDAKAFEMRDQVAMAMEQQFLELYFGTNSQFVDFARELIGAGNKHGAKALNEAVRILGSNADPARVISQIRREHEHSPSNSDSELMAEFGISFDGERYHFQSYRYDKLSDAVNYARIQRSRVKT